MHTVVEFEYPRSSMTQSSCSPSPLKRPAAEEYPNGDPNAPLNPASVKNTDSCVPLYRTGEVEHNYSCAGPAPGSIAFRWIYGSRVAALNRDPRIQVVAYNEDT